MPDRQIEEAVKECNIQLDLLYAHFGAFLYENIENENLYYCFNSQDKQFEKEADVLLQKIKYYSDDSDNAASKKDGIDKEAGQTDLLKLASGRLKDETLSRKEKLELLSSIFCSASHKAVDFLSDLIKEADFFLKKQLVELFKEVNNPVLIDVYRRLIKAEDSFLRLHAIMGLRRLDSKQTEAFLISAVDDLDPYIRRFAANYLNYPGSDPEVAAIARLANDSDEAVARIAIRKLGRAKGSFSLVNLIPKLKSPSAKIRKEAIQALKVMTGTDLGYRYLASEQERQISVENWQKFWDEDQTKTEN